MKKYSMRIPAEELLTVIVPYSGDGGVRIGTLIGSIAVNRMAQMISGFDPGKISFIETGFEDGKYKVKVEIR